MKSIKLVLAAVAALFLAVSCGQKKNAPRILVLYYSQTSNTKALAEEIASSLEADIEQVLAIKPYDGEYEKTIQRCIQERESGVLPEVQSIKADLDSYDVIFVGYPIWFGTYALPMAAALNSIDLKGKKIVPFCTFGSGGLSSSTKDLARKFPDAQILPGYGVRAARMDAMPDEVKRFLIEGGFIEGHYEPLEDFPAAHAVSEEESDIFDAAVYGYRMIDAKARSVAARTVPGGTEYMFTAIPTPHEGRPAPETSEMIIYVSVLDGKDPVFTQVVR